MWKLKGASIGVNTRKSYDKEDKLYGHVSSRSVQFSLRNTSEAPTTPQFLCDVANVKNIGSFGLLGNRDTKRVNKNTSGRGPPETLL